MGSGIKLCRQWHHVRYCSREIYSVSVTKHEKEKFVPIELINNRHGV